MPKKPFTYHSAWLNIETANNLFNECLAASLWEQETIKLFGKLVKVPRLVAWVGDPEAIYTYSGVRHVPKPWPNFLISLKDHLNHFLDSTFNAVLINYYRDGKDYMGWHQDNERELGDNPMIASLSLGATRQFSFRHKSTKTRLNLLLEHGSLLIMLPGLQNEWQHALPKTANCHTPRINLTFRHIVQLNH